jgi:F0F1-type ATP synthase delta subunit
MTNQADVIAKTIIAHLRDSGNIKLLGAVVDALHKSSEYKNSKNHVVVSSAMSLDPSELKGIKAYLNKTIGAEYELIELVDPHLVAGFTLQVNDTFIDASVLGKINLVQNKLIVKD